MGLGLFACPTLLAQSWDPFPALSGGRYSVVGRGVDAASLNGLEKCLSSVESEVGASYFAAVVRVSDRNGRDSAEFNDAVPYTDALYQKWRGYRRLNPESHILVVMALANRAVAIHPGSRWADLGFEGHEITRLVDGSRFGDLARGGDFDRAICALAQDVDRELSRLVGAEEKRVADLTAEIGRAEKNLAKLPGQIREFSKTMPIQAAALADPLAEAASNLSMARRSLQRDRQSDALNQLAAARRHMDSVERRIERDHGLLASLKDLRVSLERQQARLEKGPRQAADSFAKSRGLASTCDSTLSLAEAELLEGQGANIDQANRCIADLRAEIAAADTAYFFHEKVLPLAIMAALALIFLMTLIFLVARRRKAQIAAEEEITRWQGKLANAAERLLELEGHHPLYFSPDGRRWVGESRQLDQDCADAVNRIYLLYGHATELLDRAEEKRDGGGWLRAGAYIQARFLLRETEIRLDTGAPSPGRDHRRIFLPLTVEYTSTAADLLDDLDAAYSAAMEQLDRVAEIDLRHRQLEEEVERAAEDALAACSRRGELGMPTRETTAEIDPLLDEKRRVGLELIDDPISAIEALSGLLTQFQDKAERTLLGNKTLEELRGPVTELARALQRRLTQLRADGFRVEEPGFQPDLRLDRGFEQAKRIEVAVSEDRPHEADDEMKSLFSGLAELEEQIAATARARDGIPGALRALGAEIEALEDKIPITRRHLAHLQEAHSPETYGREADNLDEIHTLLEGLADGSKQIADDHREQRYLSALEDLETARRQLAEGRSLVLEVESIRQELDRSRTSCRQNASQLETTLDSLAEAASAAGISVELGALADQLTGQAMSLLEACRQPRPNWQRLESETEAMLEQLGLALAQMRQETKLFHEALGQLDTFSERLRELGREVQAERRDRLHVLQAVQESQALLTAWQESLERAQEGRSRAGGRALFDAARGVEAKIAWARGIWKSELELIHLAESELAAATALLRQEEGRHHGYGVVAECAAARADLDAARAAERSLEWEAALASARRAREEVQREADACRREAASRQEEERRRIAARRAAEEAERRRQERARRAAAEARRTAEAERERSTSWSSSQSSSSSFGSSSSSRSSSSRSSSSKSSASRSSSSRSSSGWSSGTRSGGSSFMSSSSSRSGGSSW